MNCSINRKNLRIYETQNGFLVTFAATLLRISLLMEAKVFNAN